MTDLQRQIRLGRAEFRREFMAMVAELRKQLPISKIQRYLAAGRAQELTQVVEQASMRLADSWSNTFLSSGKQVEKSLRAMGMNFSFDQFGDRLVSLARRNRFRLSQSFASDQAAAIRGALIEALRGPHSRRREAEMIYEALGLSNYHRQAVVNYRGGLLEGTATTQRLRDRRSDRKVASGQLSAAQVRGLTGSYQNRMLAHRAATLAETESRRAAHAGAHEAYRQAVDAGLLRPDQILQTWSTRGDGSVRDAHTAMQGQERLFGEPFSTGAGNLLKYPGDPDGPASETVRCRCSLSFDVSVENNARSVSV